MDSFNSLLNHKLQTNMEIVKKIVIFFIQCQDNFKTCPVFVLFVVTLGMPNICFYDKSFSFQLVKMTTINCGSFFSQKVFGFNQNTYLNCMFMSK